MQIKKRTGKTALQFCPFARRSEGMQKIQDRLILFYEIQNL